MTFPTSMQARSVLFRDPKGGLPALFRERRAAYSYNTRVAIRQSCDLLGLKPGDEVLAPAYNCGSEIDPLRHAGLTVSLYRVDRRGGIDLASIQETLTPRTKAIYLTHYFGFLQTQTAVLRRFCDERGLLLMEDCALSLLTEGAGNVGDVSFFCIYKFFPTIVGGAMVINNPRFMEQGHFYKKLPIRMTGKSLLRAGVDMLVGVERRTAFMRFLKPRGAASVPPPAIGPGGYPDMPAYFYFDPRLRDARISSLTARQIGSFDLAATIAARRANYRTYLAALSDLPGAEPLFPTLTDGVCPLAMPVVVENRDALAGALMARGVAALPWWAGYNRYIDFSDYPDACYLKEHVLSLPVHQYLRETDVKDIAQVLGGLIADYSPLPQLKAS